MKPIHDVPEVSISLYATYHPYYKEKSGITKSAYKPFLLQPFSQLLSPSVTLSNYIVQVIKLLYVVQGACITRLVIYHLHYKNKLSNPTQTLVCTISSLYFGCSLGSLGNLSTVSLFGHDGRVCVTKLGLVSKKGELPKTALYFSHLF